MMKSFVIMTPKAAKIRTEPSRYRYENVASFINESKMALIGKVKVMPRVVMKGPRRRTERAQQ